MKNACSRGILCNLSYKYDILNYAIEIKNTSYCYLNKKLKRGIYEKE